MDIAFVLENGLLNELINLELREIGNVAQSYQLFVPRDKTGAFESEMDRIQQQYDDGVKAIDEYEAGKYEDIVRGGGSPKFEEEPSYLQGNLEAKCRDEIVALFKCCFDPDMFRENKGLFAKARQTPVEVKEDVSQLKMALSTIRRRLYSFLSIVGYYQRHKRYFIKRSDVYKVCCKYSREVCRMNEDLGMGFRYFYFFGSWGRVDVKQGFLDVDKISLQSLVTPYLTSNTEVLCKITDIITDSFGGKYGNDGWSRCMREVGEYIGRCEKEGIMKVC